MLLITFICGGDRYGLGIEPIQEIIPLVNCRNIPRTPAYVAGIFDYHGDIVPVIDLNALISRKPSRGLFSTRIILINYPVDKDRTRILGLKAEMVASSSSFTEDDIVSPGIAPEQAPYLDRIVRDGEGMIHILDLFKLLPDKLKRILFTEE